MLKLIRQSPNGLKLVAKLVVCGQNSAISTTAVSGRRQTFSRQPYRVLTDAGKDYFQETDYKEPVSSAKLEYRPKGQIDRNERREYNKYFDEGFTDDFLKDNDNDFQDDYNQRNRRKVGNNFKNNTHQRYATNNNTFGDEEENNFEDYNQRNRWKNGNNLKNNFQKRYETNKNNFMNEEEDNFQNYNQRNRWKNEENNFEDYNQRNRWKNGNNLKNNPQRRYETNKNKFMDEEEYDFEDRDQENYQKPKQQKKQQNREKTKYNEVLKPKISGIPVYEKLGDNNTEFVKIMTKTKSRKQREKEDLMILEGKRLISDAIEAGVQLKAIYFSKEENLIGIPELDRLVAGGMKLKKVFYKDIQLFSNMSSSPGLVAVTQRPDQRQILTNLEFSGERMPLIIIGDNIRDPGNLGTMIRCATAVGAMKLVLTKGCVDAFESKVLRSAAGAHFRLSIANDVEWPLIFNHLPIDKPFDLYVAESNENFAQNSDEYNVKGDQRKLLENIPVHTINTIRKEVDIETKETFLYDESFDNSNESLFKYRNLTISSTNYCDTKFYTLGIDRPTVLVIGGETHGLSDQSYKLAYDFIGRKIRIPLTAGVDSLNSAVAAAVIMYEMKRQFHCQLKCLASDKCVQQNNI
ncbi:rRNA methyltransferase 3, mitochondrial-like [Oppia nitens]|uniref:rRNA methyltransferase 3, mitochondrial-like n=1 Tax=Oppia nitens TaxID=1686743 RepID=UPI0023DC14B8|nr:rRNA methyltransferase 3, mitochondrial-like [Oppia nitens]